MTGQAIVTCHWSALIDADELQIGVRKYVGLRIDWRWKGSGHRISNRLCLSPNSSRIPVSYGVLLKRSSFVSLLYMTKKCQCHVKEGRCPIEFALMCALSIDRTLCECAAENAFRLFILELNVHDSCHKSCRKQEIAK